jgi:hypothetical protein
MIETTAQLLAESRWRSQDHRAVVGAVLAGPT